MWRNRSFLLLTTCFVNFYITPDAIQFIFRHRDWEATDLKFQMMIVMEHLLVRPGRLPKGQNLCVTP